MQSEHLTCFVGQGHEIRLFTDQYPGHCHICGSFKKWEELRVMNQNISMTAHVFFSLNLDFFFPIDFEMPLQFNLPLVFYVPENLLLLCNN